jgi:hypothetical protein
VKRWGLDEALVRAHHLSGRGVRPEVVMCLINLILDKTGEMRAYLGHRLPFGFFGGIGFGHYTHVRHESGEQVRLRQVPAGFLVLCFLAGFIGVPLLLVWWLR